ncbi:DUF1405 domain-containing protein [Halobaculum sp. MBLA0143]|uniref:DUF1405 domain-containing protein n=1 Tax=Halobaculum sp. MBLA0143 TaxID=3079933 RepID=UPI00352608D2
MGPTDTVDSLSAPLAPLPERVETATLRLAWVVVGVNLLGTAFGFWHYRFQLSAAPLAAWPVVPDSPVATLLMAGSVASWKVGRDDDWLHALAFLGSLKYGLWVVYVQLVVNDVLVSGSLYQWFLLWSHLGMGLQALVVYRYATFDPRAVAVAVGWFGFNDVVDYFVPIGGDYYHTHFGPGLAGASSHAGSVHHLAAVGAVGLTALGTYLALAVRVRRLERRQEERRS